jgi:hypothetical protein
MFCAQGLIFGGSEGDGSLFLVLRSRNRFRKFRGRRDHFHVLLSRTLFRRYRGHRVPFSCIALPESFSLVPSASGLVFKFCAAGIVFGGIGGVRSLFHVLRSRNHFRRSQGRRVPFSCFALHDSFSAVTGSTGPFFLFCATGLVFGGTEGVGSRFHVLR